MDFAGTSGSSIFVAMDRIKMSLWNRMTAGQLLYCRNNEPDVQWWKKFALFEVFESYIERRSDRQQFFETDLVDPTKLYQLLENLIKNLINKVLNPSAHKTFDYLVDIVKDRLNPNARLGFYFENACEESSLLPEEITAIRQRCQDFLVKLIVQFPFRLPNNLSLLRDISVIRVHEALRYFKQKSSIWKLCKLFILMNRVFIIYENIKFLF